MAQEWAQKTGNRIVEIDLSIVEGEVIDLNNKEIADELNLSIRTIEGYRDRIFEKIGAKNSAGVVVYAIKNKIYDI